MSVNSYSFKPTTVFNAVDKNKDGRITVEELSRFQNRLPSRHEKAHALLQDLNDYMHNWHGGPSHSKSEPKSLTLQSLRAMANNGSKNGLLNRVDFRTNRPL